MKPSESLEKAGKVLAKYKYLLVVILAGLLILLWPKGAGPPDTTEDFNLPEMEQKLTAMLMSVDGAGVVEVMLTLRTDREGVVYPRYQGALIVCDGAGDAKTQMAVLEAVTALTGLRSDAVTVLKRKT